MSARVTEADRIAASDLANMAEGIAFGGNDAAAIRIGVWDDLDAGDISKFVHRVARHREQATAELVEALREARGMLLGYIHAAGGPDDDDADLFYRINTILAEHEPTDAELLDQVCRGMEEVSKPLGEVERG